MRLRLDIGYDGTNFHGWAVQPGLRTVQGEIEKALAVVVRGEEAVRLTVGGRTDAGVHARGQVAHVDVPDEMNMGISARRLNSLLARQEAHDVVIHKVSEVPTEFDARFGALRRRYEYRLRDSTSQSDPLTSRFTAEVGRELDLEMMQIASDSLLGLQDFTSFCKAREGATAVRELLRFEWTQSDDGALVAAIEADAFCHSMVRALVGSVVAVGSSRLMHSDLLALRDARERTSRFSVMPAKGLSLEEICYPENAELAQRVEQTRAKRLSLE